MRIAVFASCNGTNFQVIAEQFPNNVKLAFSDHRDAYVLERAKKRNVLAVSLERQAYPHKQAYEEAIIKLLEAQHIDLIVLAGYMKIIGPTLLEAYKGRIINIHPSYLPDFAGSPYAIEDSHAAKRGLGVTVHYVDEGVDTGQIIAQVPAVYTASLTAYEKHIHELEYQLYPQVIKQLLADEH